MARQKSSTRMLGNAADITSDDACTGCMKFELHLEP